MIIFKPAAALQDYLSAERKKGRKTGFVPTMGALHAGHLSLIASSAAINDLTVCSIFVNPTQFNNTEDFQFYPVTIEKDIELLATSGCDILFLPPVPEIYPAGYQPQRYELGPIENLLEGLHRPGHFQGVCQVVDRLTEIVQPDAMYLGRKDFQQCQVIKKLLEIKQRTHIRLELMPTVREQDGLAMSSRNLRLNEKEKALATSIFNELNTMKARLKEDTLDLLKSSAKDNLRDKGFDVDYVEIVDASSFEPAGSKDQSLVALIAATIGNIRLIDNMELN